MAGRRSDLAEGEPDGGRMTECSVSGGDMYRSGIRKREKWSLRGLYIVSQAHLAQQRCKARFRIHRAQRRMRVHEGGAQGCAPDADCAPESQASRLSMPGAAHSAMCACAWLPDTDFGPAEPGLLGAHVSDKWGLLDYINTGGRDDQTGRTLRSSSLQR
jgi:hypothetical protein